MQFASLFSLLPFAEFFNAIKFIVSDLLRTTFALLFNDNFSHLF